MAEESSPPSPRQRRWRWLYVGGGAVGIVVLAVAGLLVIGGGDQPGGRANAGSAQPASALSFSDCRGCHRDIDLIFEQGRALKGIQFTHAKHFAKATSDCASCHVAQPHLINATVRPDHLRCFSCHGAGTGGVTRAGPQLASGECSTCHVPGTIPKPASHKTSTWLQPDHGKAALDSASAPTCLTCHTHSSCTTCHGLEMPHPVGFEGAAHGKVPTGKNYALCAKCHGGNATAVKAFCEGCHHPGKPAATSMVTAHTSIVGSQGATTCYRCHDAASFCTKCHGVQMPHPSGFSGAGHVSAASSAGTAVCAKCHGGGGATCDSCHHSMKSAGSSMTSFHGGYVDSHGASTCYRCHTTASCTSCHGIAMPHPSNWQSAHTSKSGSRAVCAKCHSGGTSGVCTVCHGTRCPPVELVSAHTSKSGSRAVCAKCHSGGTSGVCTTCHGIAMPHPSNWSSTHAPAIRFDDGVHQVPLGWHVGSARSAMIR